MRIEDARQVAASIRRDILDKSRREEAMVALDDEVARLTQALTAAIKEWNITRVQRDNLRAGIRSMIVATEEFGDEPDINEILGALLAGDL